MSKEAYKIEAHLSSNRIVSSYLKDGERAVEVLSEIKKRGYSQFFDYRVLDAATLYQATAEHDWIELERWQRPQPLTSQKTTCPRPLARIRKPRTLV